MCFVLLSPVPVKCYGAVSAGRNGECVCAVYCCGACLEVSVESCCYSGVLSDSEVCDEVDPECSSCDSHELLGGDVCVTVEGSGVEIDSVVSVEDSFEFEDSSEVDDDVATTWSTNVSSL